MEKILDDLIDKGKTEQAKETAINLKNMNMDEEIIAKAVGRDTETVKKWVSFN